MSTPAPLEVHRLQLTECRRQLEHVEGALAWLGNSRFALALVFVALLFFVAGYFTPASYDSKGPGGFMMGRLRRLGRLKPVPHECCRGTGETVHLARRISWWRLAIWAAAWKSPDIRRVAIGVVGMFHVFASGSDGAGYGSAGSAGDNT